jgi:group II intron reverse transcriptase/maturase
MGHSVGNDASTGNGRSALKPAKPFEIPKQLVVDAYRRIKANKGSPGIDDQSIQDFESDLKNNLYKLWNRLSSGSYHPPAVKRVYIAKTDGKQRPLGIPTVSDRIAQMVVKLLIEPELEPHFHPDSYGYRPGKSAHQALKKTEERSRKRAWVLDMDIKGFFDNLDHGLMMRAVEKHVSLPWARLYIQRWLKAPVQYSDGRQEARHRGTPQGGVISPLLANLYLHYTFDKWMERHHPRITFERYADDIVCHCIHQAESEMLKAQLERRFAECGLTLHPEKTKVVYCKSERRRGSCPIVSFDFLGYTFKPRWIRNRHGKRGVYFMASISQKAAKHIRMQIRRLPWSYWQWCGIEQISHHCQNRLRGWINYFKLFGESDIRNVLFYFDKCLRRWAKRKYKAMKTVIQAVSYVNSLRNKSKGLFAHWRCNQSNKGWMAGAV